ncbi:cupin domain-containing protein [Streptomyces sp. NPDC006365]|uniref:cupin domain-containing protein n=1 Tax=Streptomyces sp. NPDC006365 TaxID=3364744 RepID=UPI0036CBF0C2
MSSPPVAPDVPDRTRDDRAWLRSPDRYPDVGALGYGTTPANWAVSFEHGLSEHLIHFVVAGRYEGVAGRRRIRAGPGTLVWIKPGVPFALRATGAGPLALYRLQLPSAPAEDPPLGPVVVLPGAWELRAPLDLLTGTREARRSRSDRRSPGRSRPPTPAVP